MNAALVCIARGEDNYIEEWVEYNLKIGFEKIFIYQDRWVCALEHPDVVKMECLDQSRGRQSHCYNHFVQNVEGFTHAAFFDVDEFLVLKKHKSLSEFLDDYADCQSIGINWVHFGDNGLKEVANGEYGVVERFTMRRRAVSDGVKNIFKINRGISMSVHHPHCEWSCTDKKLHTGAGNPDGKDDIAQLNHYYCKTIQEFVDKKMVYRADDYPININEFHRYNFNEIEDLSCRRFFRGR